MYAEGNFPVNVKVEHLGNTNVTFDLEATVFSAIPTDVTVDLHSLFVMKDSRVDHPDSGTPMTATQTVES